MKPAPGCLLTHPSSISLPDLKARHKIVSQKQPNLRKAKASPESLWLMETSSQSHRGVQLRKKHVLCSQGKALVIK